jgi:hypothetical protein
MVTGLRALAMAVPKGECELDRTCQAVTCVCGHDGDDEASSMVARRNGDEAWRVLMRARDMVKVAGEVGSRMVVVRNAFW